jgi:hypothetical protein
LILNEDIILELVGRLRTDLPAEIASINARSTVGIPISMPADTDIFEFVPPPGLLMNYPAIGIGDAPSKFEDDIGSSATGVHEILIVAYEQAGDQRELAWKLRRLSQAIATVALSGRELGTAAWGTTLSSIVPGPTLVDDADNPQEWMSWVGVRITAKADED